MRGSMRFIMASSAALLVLTGTVAAAGTASAATHYRHVTVTPAVSGNSCHLPTSAGAGSGYKED